MLNQIMQAVNRNQANIGYVRLGYVSSVNPANSAIKVVIEPEGTETGFMAYSTPWIGGPSCGWYAPPAIGTKAVVLFQEGDQEVPIGAFLLWHNGNMPPSGVAEGEALLLHKSGASIKLSNDGKILLNGATEIDAAAPALNITTTGNVNVVAGGSANIDSDSVNLGHTSGALQSLINAIAVAVYNGHTHNDPQGGVTGVPNQQIDSSAITSNVKAT